jgi:hypothetical protein
MIEKLNNIKRSRLKIVVFFGVILSLLTGYSVYEGMEGTATVGIGLIGALAGKFVHDESNSPSKPREDETTQ